MGRHRLDPVHPGEVLRQELVEPLALTRRRLARDLNMPIGRLSGLLQEKRRITADTALRLARYFNMSPQFWMGLQMDYDLDVEMDRLGPRLKVEVGRYVKT